MTGLTDFAKMGGGRSKLPVVSALSLFCSFSWLADLLASARETPSQLLYPFCSVFIAFGRGFVRTQASALPSFLPSFSVSSLLQLFPQHDHNLSFLPLLSLLASHASLTHSLTHFSSNYLPAPSARLVNSFLGRSQRGSLFYDLLLLLLSFVVQMGGRRQS